MHIDSDDALELTSVVVHKELPPTGTRIVAGIRESRPPWMVEGEDGLQKRESRDKIYIKTEIVIHEH